MWYARMGQPTRDNMKKRVAALPDSCDITPEDVDLLPWAGGGALLNVNKMNELLLRDHEPTGDDDKKGAAPITLEKETKKTSSSSTTKETKKAKGSKKKHHTTLIAKDINAALEEKATDITPPAAHHEDNHKKKVEDKKTELDEETYRKCYMWYARMGQPTRDNMKKRVAALPDSCDITPEDVDLLPWVGGGSLLNVNKMNKLLLEG
jgi:hypothetical protein